MIVIKIETDNAAFEGNDCGTEIARILRTVADNVDEDRWHDDSQVERTGVELLQACSGRWADVVQLLSSDA